MRSHFNTTNTLPITNLHLQAEKEPLLKLTAVEMTVPRITCQSVNLEPKRFHSNITVPNICFHLIYPSETSFAASRFILVSCFIFIYTQSILFKQISFFHLHSFICRDIWNILKLVRFLFVNWSLQLLSILTNVGCF